MSRSAPITRRSVLRGIGTALSMPVLEAMVPSVTRAAQAATSTADGAINRMIFIMVPNGKVMEDWTPAQEGAAFELPPLLQPLAAVRSELTVLSGLGHANALPMGDGPGDHARAAASYLTGVHPYKTGGKDIRTGISVDQLAAQRIGQLTHLASLEMGCDKSRNSGDCDSGYSCAYSHNISWRTAQSPAPKETNPRLVFERLFSSSSTGTPADSAQRARYRRSILDLVSDDATRLRGRLGVTDQRKLDEYFTSIRELERRIERLNQATNAPSDQPAPNFKLPEGPPRSYQEHVRVMYDLLALALQADVTRIATFMVADESSNRSYPFLDVSEGHHSLSHHGGEQAKIDALRKINHWHVGEFARFVQRLKAMPEGNGSVLDHAQIVYGSDLADGNRHDHLNLPVLLVGRGNRAISPGQHLRFPKRTPMCNLFVSMLRSMNLKADSFGDSTGALV